MPFDNYRDFTADNRAILNKLKSGRDYTANQLRTQLDITNISARINDLRNAGYPIYLNTKRSANRTIRVYRLGSASRRDLAIARLVKKDSVLSTQLSALVNQALSLV